MITLSETDKLIISEIVNFIARNPTKEQTNKKLIIGFCEHLVNLTYPPKESQGQPSLCKLTKGYCMPFENRQTGERQFLCIRCKSFHNQGHVQPIGEILDEDASEFTGNSKKTPGESD